MNKKIDLHMHTSYSDDGDLTPKEIMKRALKENMTHIAITDHNNVDALDEAMSIAKKYKINLIPAIEIDCVYKGKNLHVIGYGIDYKKSIFNDIRDDVLHQEQRGSLKKLQLLKENTDLIFEESEVMKKSINGVITGEMVGEVVLEEPKNRDNSLLKEYFDKGIKSDMPTVHFYWDFFSQGKVGYVEMKFPELKDIIKIIKETGGVSILAHPGNNLKDNPQMIFDIIEEGIDGIEVYSSYHTSENVERFYKIAKDNNLLITCGSDFHGKHKPQIEMGDFKEQIDFNEILDERFVL